MAKKTKQPDPITLSEITDALELPASGRARVYQIVRRLGIEPVRRVGHADLYPADALAAVRAELDAASKGAGR